MPLYCACPEKTHLSTSRQRPKTTSVLSKQILSMPSLYFLSSPTLPHDRFTSKRRLRTYATGVHNCFKWLAELRLRSSWSQVWSYDTSSRTIVFVPSFATPLLSINRFGRRARPLWFSHQAVRLRSWTKSSTDHLELQ